jgi:uncharacterized protein (TIRG00374 family)
VTTGPSAEIELEAGAASARSRRRRTVMWVIGLAVTCLSLWLALRDVPLNEVGEVLSHTHWPVLLLLGVPAQIASIYVRALRWRHLTDAIQPIPVFPLFRATSIGFMANNLLPGRAGEVLRAWVLSRETGASGASLMGTVVLERVIDSVTFLVLASAVLLVGGTRALGGGMIVAATFSLVLFTLLPVALLLWLRIAPQHLLSVLHRLLSDLLPRWLARVHELLGRIVPVATSARVEQAFARFVRMSLQVEGLLVRFAEGLGSLRGGRHLFWVIVYSVLLWAVISVIPFYAGVRALGIDLGSPTRMLAAGYVTLAAVGLAVALPAAPGFFGTFHLACKEALGVFGVPDSTAFAMAVLVHGTFWVTVTALGLVLLPFGRAGLRAGLEAAASDQDPGPARR